MQMIFFPFVNALLFSLLIVPSLQAAELPPIPPMPEKFKKIQIVQPDPSLPKDITDLLGEWEGTWIYEGGNTAGFSHGEELRRAKLIIYSVSKDKVKFLWGVGESPKSAARGGWSDNESKIIEKEGKKGFNFIPGSGFNILFLLEDGHIRASQKGPSTMKMRRVR